MARPQGRLNNGVLLLDSHGLWKLTQDDAQVASVVRAAQAKDALVAVSNLTLIEACHPKVSLSRFRWFVSRLEVLPVTDEISWRAIGLLRDAGLHGHKYAIDAVVASTALGYPGPRIVVTSDPVDLNKLCGDQVRVLAV